MGKWIELAHRYGQIYRDGASSFLLGAPAGFKEFKDHPWPQMDHSFGVCLLPGQKTSDQLCNRVTDTLGVIEEQHGIRFLMAGRDFPFHITLQLCTLPTFDPESIIKKLNQNPSLRETAQKFIGTVIPLNSCLPDRGNILIASLPPVIPDSITEARIKLSSIYGKESATPTPISVVHSTIARVHTDTTTPIDRTAYLHYVKILSQTLHQRPLTFSVESVFTGKISDLFR